MKKIFIAIFILISFGTPRAEGLINIYKIGTYVGLGNIAGNSPLVFSYFNNLSVDLSTSLTNDFDIRLSAMYAQDFNIIIPEENEIKTYPFLYGGSVMVVARQPIAGKFFLEGGGGFLWLQDRTFTDIDEAAYGTVVTAMIGYDLSPGAFRQKGFRIGFGIEYGATFTGNTPQYYNNNLTVQYRF